MIAAIPHFHAPPAAELAEYQLLALVGLLTLTTPAGAEVDRSG